MEEPSGSSSFIRKRRTMLVTLGTADDGLRDAPLVSGICGDVELAPDELSV